MMRAILPAALPALAIVAAGWMVADALRPPSPPAPAAAEAEPFTYRPPPPADPACAERMHAAIAAREGNANHWLVMERRERSVDVLCAAERKYGRPPNVQ